ncbi:ADP-ribosylglycohydrolase family protein [Georgenia sp. TF02-10]|uniref:ADP-ribosylglycohydrolase family protein n=1 Tax=Georgenia sp. TF02-10 TaxID=2917725 RepID=UPI001FA6B2CF|nr:ADP-ribosylglycohydrolase family protein [Georgenia sp. TF02-10]UNX54830.1 ADP-ribosylglycohydrolase family protein [Georgenia sp. TF02-10]
MRSRARGCLAGLAVGDALGRPAEGMEPAEIAARWGRIEGYVADTPLGSDDTEYALLTAKALLRHRASFSAETVADLWREEVCGQEGGFVGGGFSEMAAIRNLERGHRPPRSGQHAHSWSDGLAMRVAPIGIAAAGNVPLAVRLAAEDGAVSHAGEGIYAGQALAAAVAIAMTGAAVVDVVAAAIEAVPADSWTARCLHVAAETAVSSPDWSVVARAAVDRLAVRDYYWADLAPEAVGLAFTAVLAGDGDVRETILNAVNLGRDADTIAAMAGAVAGAMAGIGAVPGEWLPAVAVAPGVCLRATRGMDPMAIADELCDLAAELQGVS